MVDLIDLNYFDLGGDSLRAMDVISRVHELFGVELPLIAFFEDPTIAHLSAVMDDPEPYWDALLKTRQHLAENHSYRNRFKQLEGLLADRDACGAAP